MSRGHEGEGMRRRRFLGAAGGIAALSLTGGMNSPADAQTTAAASNAPHVSGRRKLGRLEVSSVGLGVQNVTRTYDTTVPHRPEMINIIRTAFDRGVTFFDTAEAYGPHEVERILGRGHRAVPRQGRDHLQVRLEHRPGDGRAPPGAQQPARPHQGGGRRHAQAAPDRSYRSSLSAPRRPGGPDRRCRRRGQGPDGRRARCCIGGCPRWA